ncbi:alpha/beta fold hydrolase [Sphingomonas sp. SUN039]|uniref:alpha/beta fold hydrolase n=1 Tax=Sphingomonas sp. SUN039 TaxID=2937787 RepID=UPI0038D3C5AF
MGFTDGYWWSNDGLRLHYRDYAAGRGVDPARPPILCLPGLTRNARDFETVAARLSHDWRVIAVDLRGRGESAYAKDAMTYVPLTYAQDVERLLAELKIERFVSIGTSLGGIVTMLLAATGNARIAGAVLNDVGPVIEAAGLDRIRGYVGKGGAYPTWLHAARGIAETNAGVFPRYDLTDWLAMAKRTSRLSGNGRIVPDYDKKIAEPFRLPGGEAGIDLWPAFDALADVPTLIVRGALSDLLAPATVAQMVGRLKDAKTVTVADVGHAPVLDETEAAAAIDALLARIV